MGLRENGYLGVPQWRYMVAPVWKVCGEVRHTAKYSNLQLTFIDLNHDHIRGKKLKR